MDYERNKGVEITYSDISLKNVEMLWLILFPQ